LVLSAAICLPASYRKRSQDAKVEAIEEAAGVSWVVMLGRVVTTVIPTVAIGVTAVVLLGPGRQRAAIGARVWGLPVEGASVVAWRVEGVRRQFGVDDAAPLDRARLVARDEGGPLGEWTGTAGSDGIAEAVIKVARPVRGSVALEVSQGASLLAEGRIAVARREPLAVTAAKIPGSARGDISMSVEAVRGVLVAPFEDAVRVSLSGPTEALEKASIEATASGAEVRPARFGVDVHGRATFWVKPLAHMVELTLEVTGGDGKRGRWEGVLPVVPGGMWLEQAKAAGGGALGELRIIAASPKPRAYLSIVSDEGRVFGASVALVKDEAGFFSGRIQPDLPSVVGPLQAILAGDPFEQGVGTVAWPLVPPDGAPAIRRVELLIDGVPGAEARERARAGAAKRAAMMVVGAAALVEILLLVLRSRASQRALEAHLLRASGSLAGAGDTAGGSAGDDDADAMGERREPRPLSSSDRANILASARDHPLLWVLALTSIVALAFALVGAFATLG
jgi:hypothetical protein